MPPFPPGLPARAFLSLRSVHHAVFSPSPFLRPLLPRRAFFSLRRWRSGAGLGVFFRGAFVAGLLAIALSAFLPPIPVAALVPPAHPFLAAPCVAPACGVAQGWVWPLLGSPEVVRGFDPPPEPWLAGHRGVDLVAGSEVVRAAGGGLVRFAGVVVSRPLVSISHDNGLITTYEPVEPSVTVGERVQAGQVIGRLQSGHPGCPAVLCLHWGLRRGETYLDPLILVGAGRVRLLPVAGRAAPRRGGRSRPRCCRSAR